jgi:hypothetical protein
VEESLLLQDKLVHVQTNSQLLETRSGRRFAVSWRVVAIVSKRVKRRAVIRAKLDPERRALQKGAEEQTPGKRSTVKRPLYHSCFSYLLFMKCVKKCAIKKKGGPPLTYSSNCGVWRSR